MFLPERVVVIPYRIREYEPYFCFFDRSGKTDKQFLTAHMIEGETPEEAAKRMVIRDIGVLPDEMMKLQTMGLLPAGYFFADPVKTWGIHTSYVTEHCFAFLCDDVPVLSDRYSEYHWQPYVYTSYELTFSSHLAMLYELYVLLEREQKEKRSNDIKAEETAKYLKELEREKRAKDPQPLPEPAEQSAENDIADGNEPKKKAKKKNK